MVLSFREESRLVLVALKDAMINFNWGGLCHLGVTAGELHNMLIRFFRRGLFAKPTFPWLIEFETDYCEKLDKSLGCFLNLPDPSPDP